MLLRQRRKQGHRPTPLVLLLLVCLPNYIRANTNGTAPETAGGETETKIETATPKKPKLTGIPQLDYIHDPNLPRELNGYDLSDYPFFKRPNTSYNFTCDDRLDGFYASVPDRCQVYHNCLFGVRYDFLCANYTAFDQKNFICHYANEVDCDNSEKYYSRNEELYVTTTTTTPRPPPPQIIYVERPRPRPIKHVPRPNNPRRPGPKPQHEASKPQRRPQLPVYDDYSVYDDYYDYYNYYDDYYDKETTTTTTTRRPLRRRPQRPGFRRGGGGQGGRFGGIFNTRERQRPRINPPVPTDQQGNRPRGNRRQEDSPSQSQNVEEHITNEETQDLNTDNTSAQPNRPGNRRKKIRKTTTTTTTTEAAPEYYDEYYYDYADDLPNEQGSSTTITTTSTTTTTPRPRGSRPSRLSLGVNRRRLNSNSNNQISTTSPEEINNVESSTQNSRRFSSLNSRRTNQQRPQADELTSPAPQPERQETNSGNRQIPRRPQLARRPTFNRGTSTTEPEIIIEEAPLAPGIEISSNGTVSTDEGAPLEETVPEEHTTLRERRPRPALGRVGGRSRSRSRSQPSSVPDYEY